MKFTDYITEDCCVLDLKSSTSEGAIRELAGVLEAGGRITDREGFVRHVLEREALGSTGIGNEVAVPHCPSPAVKELAIAFGRSVQGIDFGSVDGRKVKYVFLMATNPGHLNVYIRMLAGLSRLLLKGEFRDKFSSLDSPKQLIEAFGSFERR